MTRYSVVFLFKISKNIRFGSNEVNTGRCPQTAMRRRMAFGDGKDDHHEL